MLRANAVVIYRKLQTVHLKAFRISMHFQKAVFEGHGGLDKGDFVLEVKIRDSLTFR